MSVPRQLSVLRDGAGMALSQRPVLELSSCGSSVVAITLKGSQTATVGHMEAPLDLHFAFTGSTTGVFGVRLYSDETHWTEIGFDHHKAEFYIDRSAQD